MKAKLFEVLERRFREMFHARPDIEMDEIHLWVTRETDGALLYTSWAEAEAVLRELDTLSVVGALMRRLYDKLGTVDNDIETFENPCLLVQTLALELCEDVVWKLYSNQMDEAIEAGDAQCIDRLAEAMVYVLTELQTQEQPNG